MAADIWIKTHDGNLVRFNAALAVGEALTAPRYLTARIGGGDEDYVHLTNQLADRDETSALGEALLRTVARLHSAEGICVLSQDGEGGWAAEVLPMIAADPDPWP